MRIYGGKHVAAASLSADHGPVVCHCCGIPFTCLILNQLMMIHPHLFLVLLQSEPPELSGCRLEIAGNCLVFSSKSQFLCLGFYAELKPLWGDLAGAAWSPADCSCMEEVTVGSKKVKNKQPGQRNESFTFRLCPVGVALCSEDESRLVTNLFTGYNKVVRPVNHFSEAVVVTVGLQLIQLISVVRQQFTLPVGGPY